MLYLTTREKFDAFTAARTLASDHGADGGRYLPYKMPHYSAEEIAALKDMSFGQTVAQVLNTFFGTRLTTWDVECCIGRFPLRLAVMGQKVFTAESKALPEKEPSSSQVMRFSLQYAGVPSSFSKEAEINF